MAKLGVNHSSQSAFNGARIDEKAPSFDFMCMGSTMQLDVLKMAYFDVIGVVAFLVKMKQAKKMHEYGK